MAVHLSFLLMLTGFTGIHSITTVSKVSVKAGTSISIPCLYESQYKYNVKYLCKGYYWNSCSYKVTTNQRNLQKYSISDDKDQRLFTVTIKDLTSEDTDYYWCIVEINRGSDDGKDFYLSVTTGLYVDNQWITAIQGNNLTISCHHRNSGETKWCRLGRSCVTRASGSIDGTRVTIDTSVHNVFTVTMTELKIESSGWYWCVKGDLQMPVHITVNEKPTTSQAPSTTVQEHETSNVRVDLKSFIIPLSLLIFTVMVTLFIWFMLKRHKQTKKDSSAAITSEAEVTYSTVSAVKKKRKTPRQAEEEVTYGNVEHIRNTPAESSDTEIKSDVGVVYSSVVTVKPQTEQKVKAKAEDVTYSTLAQHQQNL